MRVSPDGSSFAPDRNDPWQPWLEKLRDAFDKRKKPYRLSDLERFAQHCCTVNYNQRSVIQWWYEFDNFCNR